MTAKTNEWKKGLPPGRVEKEEDAAELLKKYEVVYTVMNGPFYRKREVAVNG